MIQLTTEVHAALREGRPVVALETSVVTHGLPHPENLESARACERAVREAGAIPASIAVIDGEIRVGLSTEQMQRLGEVEKTPYKIGSRDLPLVAALHGTGGTTVSATCEVAARAGIRVFVTGGIGGVHRGAPEQLDVSQDLWAISRFPVAVVCAGAKSVLDLPKTLELLEALGVPVVGVGTDEFPSFYRRGSGLPLEHWIGDAEAAARMMKLRFDELRQGGMLFALPPPETTAFGAPEIESHIEAAVALAGEREIRGKALTPFLLMEIARRTGGKSLKANMALLAHNAQFAGQLASADARMRSGADGHLERA